MKNKIVLLIACVAIVVSAIALTVMLKDKEIKLSKPELKGDSFYNNKIELEWKPVKEASGYEIYCNDKLIKTVKSEEYRQTGLKKDTSYDYKIRALAKSSDDVFYSDYSNTVTLKTKFREPRLLMVDEEDKRVVDVFEKYAGLKVDTVFSYSEIDTDKYDGLVIPGGGNITPDKYGEEWHPSTHDTNAEKDDIQIDAVKEFVKAKKPVLGLCRGNQIINVAFGGTIRQNLDLENDKSVYQKKYHEVENLKGYWMYDLFGETQTTYQYHHQCVGELGEGLIATSYSKNYEFEHIESIQHEKLPVYGTQWHPESKVDEVGSAVLFTDFKRICLENMGK